MAKPRVIIADTDEGYISTIQLKFVKEYFDKIELEIITDKEYFDELFSKPQKADILIVSEELYDVTLQKHNISNIFLMMEKEEEEQTGDLNVSRMYKYTSIKEIFNEITGKSSQTLNLDENEKKKTQVVLVTSAAGGVGKTTIALGISECLAKNYKRVLYINAGRLQAFQYMFENSAPISIGEVLSSGNDNIYWEIKHLIRNEHFSYLPQFKTSLLSMGVNFDIFEKIVQSAQESNDFDYIIVDSENAFDEYLTKLIDISDRVVVITSQAKKQLCYTNQFVNNINGVNGEKYLFLCNEFSREKNNYLVNNSENAKFRINEYIDYIDNMENMKISELAKVSGIMKSTFLLL